MGHSAGAQLAALTCTDDRYLMAEGLSLAIIKGCVPVDGDTFDVPAIIETAETRGRVHGLPQAKYGHREKFGNDPAKHRDISAVTHVAKDKGIPPFLILHVAEHPDTPAQGRRLGNVAELPGTGVAVEVSLGGFPWPASQQHPPAPKNQFAPGSVAARTGTLSQEKQAEQKSEAEPSREHHCDLSRSQLPGNSNGSIAIREESIPFGMVNWRGERPARSDGLRSLDSRYWIKGLTSHERPSHWCHAELTYRGLR